MKSIFTALLHVLAILAVFISNKTPRLIFVNSGRFKKCNRRYRIYTTIHQNTPLHKPNTPSVCALFSTATVNVYPTTKPLSYTNPVHALPCFGNTPPYPPQGFYCLPATKLTRFISDFATHFCQPDWVFQSGDADVVSTFPAPKAFDLSMTVSPYFLIRPAVAI